MGSKIIAIPGVGNVEFPDSMSDDAIGAVIRQQFGPQLTKAAVNGSPRDLMPAHAPTKATPMATGHAPTNYTPEQMQQAANYRGRFDVPGLLNMYKDLGAGALKGAGNTVYNMASSGMIPGMPSELVNAVVPKKPDVLTPANLPQNIGYTGEQIGEWLLPSGVEEKAAQLAASKLPKAFARMGAAAAESGIRNLTQGGDFGTGAVAGGIGSGVVQTAKAAAPVMANIAARAGKRLLKSIPEGIDIGQVILDNSTGVKPSVITAQLGNKVTAAENAMQAAVNAADQRGAQVALGPARQTAADELAVAINKNSPNYIRDVEKIQNQLANQHGPSGNVAAPLPANVPPSKARALKQGIDMDINTWNPEAQGNIAPLQERVRGSINQGFHAAVPESAALDAQMTQMIPARDAMWNVSYDPSVARSVFNRIGRPTGALAGTLYGGYEGQKQGGTLGAIGGASLGLVAPELVASPAGQMALARMLNSPVAGNALIPFAKGVFLQAFRDTDGKVNYRFVRSAEEQPKKE